MPKWALLWLCIALINREWGPYWAMTFVIGHVLLVRALKRLTRWWRDT